METNECSYNISACALILLWKALLFATQKRTGGTLLACTQRLSTLGFYRSDTHWWLPCVSLSPAQSLGSAHRWEQQPQPQKRQNLHRGFSLHGKGLWKGHLWATHQRETADLPQAQLLRGSAAHLPDPQISVCSRISLGWEFFPQPQPGGSHGGEGGEMGQGHSHPISSPAPPCKRAFQRTGLQDEISSIVSFSISPWHPFRERKGPSVFLAALQLLFLSWRNVSLPCLLYIPLPCTHTNTNTTSYLHLGHGLQRDSVQKPRGTCAPSLTVSSEH